MASVDLGFVEIDSDGSVSSGFLFDGGFSELEEFWEDDVWEPTVDAHVNFYSAGYFDDWDDLEDSAKSLFEDVFPSLDEESILTLSELNIEFMEMEHKENKRRVTAQAADEFSYVRAVQASSGLSIDSKSFKVDRRARQAALQKEWDWMDIALEKNIEITRAETLKEIDIMNQQLTAQNINTAVGVFDVVDTLL